MPDDGHTAVNNRADALLRIHRKVRSKTTWKTWLAILAPGGLFFLLLILFIAVSPNIQAQNRTILGLYLRYNDWRVWLFAVFLSKVLGVTAWIGFVIYRLTADKGAGSRKRLTGNEAAVKTGRGSTAIK